MKIDFLTLFPEMIEAVMGQSMMKRAQDSGVIDIHITNFREYGIGKHQIVDDTPYGGGPGMLLKPEPLFEAVDAINDRDPDSQKTIILLDPAGRTFDQMYAEDLATKEHLVFICGHYEGYDERIRTLATDEISLGDYVLTGGELGALVIADATIRLIPGVLGNRKSSVADSHSTGLLEHPHYTRPAIYRGMSVPEILLSGHHEMIDQWRHQQSLIRTAIRRPDMLANYPLTEADQSFLNTHFKEK